MRRYVLLMFLIHFLIGLQAQSYEKTFSKNSGLNRFLTVEILNDSMIIVGGQTSAGVGNDDALISILKSDGTIISNNVFGRTGRDYIYDAEIDIQHGNFIFGGNTMEGANSADNFFMGVYDIATNTIQMQNYAGTTTADDQFRQIAYTSDHYLIGVGEISQSNDAAIVKMDTLGNVIWQKKHNFAGSSTRDQFRDIREVPGQGYIISGFAEQLNSANFRPTLTRIDNNGNQLWSRIYTDSSIGAYSSQPLVYTSDGGFMMSSLVKNGSQNDILVTKTDGQGIVQWSKRYGGTADETLLFLKEVANNQFIFGGKTLSYGNVGGDGYLTKIDNQGNIIWSRAFGKTGQAEEFWDAEQYINGTDIGFYAVGLAAVSSSSQGAYLIKIQDDGSGLDCHSVAAPFTVQNRTVTTIDGGSFSNWSGTLPYTMTQNTTTFTESERTCLYVDLDGNNSTATGADFSFGTFCYPSLVLIADVDAYIDNASPISSAQITISNGIINTGNEILTLANNFGLLVNGNNSTSLTLTNSGNNTTADFENAIKNIQYQNTATYISAGVRQVNVTVYSGTVTSNTAQATFEILPTDIFLNLGNDTTICQNETLFLDVTTNLANNYVWQNGSTNSTFTINQAGMYIVTASNNCQTETDTIIVQYTATQLQLDLGNDTILCIGESLVLDVTNSTAESYLWQDGSTNSNFIVTQSGMYFVAVSDTCVTIMDTINVIFTGDFPMPNLGNDTVLCQGDALILNGFSPIANTYLWNDGSTNSTLTVNSGGQYIVTTTNNCGSTNDTINIQLIISELVIDLGNDTTLCNGDELLLDAFNSTALSYEWQDGSTNDNFLVIQTGNYKVTATDFCTTFSDSIFIEYITLNVDLGNDTAICEGQIILLDAYHPNAENYTWQNGSTNSYFAIQKAGQYTVTVENHCETVSDTIEVTVSTQTPLVPNLGLNRVLCPGATEILDATTENALTYVWQDSTEGAIYIVTEPGIYEVTVSNACLILTDEIEFTAGACCNLFVPDAFTPNDDGINDIFHAFTNCQGNDFSMTIYDRWGGKLFETTDINTGWDGTKSGQLLNTGVYVYVLSFNDGFSTRKSEGSFTLIR